jgi:[ribosomal protein S18]-alanine N-acetyltransferase
VVAVHRFRHADLAHVMAVERASFGRYAWPREWLASYAEAFPDLFLVASVEGRAVGYSAAAVARGWAELVSIAVLPSFRRRGVARMLLLRTLRILRRKKIRGVSLMVRTDNTAARHFYQTFGFRRVRVVPGYYEDGSEGVRMRLPLPPISG